MRGVNDQAGLRLADQGVDMRRAMIGCTVLSMTFWTMGVAGSGAAAPAGFAASAGGSSARADFNGDGFADLAVGVPGVDRERGAVNVIYGSARGLTAVDQYWTQDRAGIQGRAEANDSFGSALAAGDFNGDGFADLAVGVPGEDSGRGAVNVIYGSARGLTATDQYWTQGSPGIKGTARANDSFGSSLVAANFGRSSQADLAIGVPSKADGGGAVNVIYGSAGGLTASGDQYWTQDSPGIIGRTQGMGVDMEYGGDRFGSALAAANFGKSAQADLAVGVPGENVGVGAVNVLYGSAGGLTASGDQYWTQDTPGIKGVGEILPGEDISDGDAFGFSLAAANFGKSAQADLAVGVPQEDNIRGAVNVIYGSSGGLTASGDQYWTQDSPGIQGRARPLDRFGFALAAANFGRSAQADLAVGVPEDKDVGGAVNVLYGSARGLTAVDQYWTQGTPGIKSAGGWSFGFALGAANFGRSAHADLAVGLESGAGGAVNVLYGSSHGLTAAGGQYWTQDTPGIKGRAEGSDRFGSAFAAGGPG